MRGTVPLAFVCLPATRLECRGQQTRRPGKTPRGWRWIPCSGQCGRAGAAAPRGTPVGGFALSLGVCFPFCEMRVSAPTVHSAGDARKSGPPRSGDPRATREGGSWEEGAAGASALRGSGAPTTPGAVALALCPGLPVSPGGTGLRHRAGGDGGGPDLLSVSEKIRENALKGRRKTIAAGEQSGGAGR